MAKGAGILIIESYKGQPVITLFGKDGFNYADLGGRIDPGESPEEAACREAREESANLINIGPHEIVQYSIPVKHQEYVAFIMYVDGIFFKDYAHNINVIFTGCNPYKQKHWMETNSMARIPLNNILLAAQAHIDYANDVNGSVVQIRGRTMGLIRNAYNVIANIVQTNPTPLYKHNVTSSRIPCLIGTYTYTISSTAIYTSQIQPYQHQSYQIQKTGKESKYAIYIGPDLNAKSSPFLSNCNPQWGGMHVTIAGFHPDNIDAKKFIKYLSSQGSTKWTVSINKIKVNNKNNTIYFESNTLDNIASFLKKNKFQKVKGPKYSGEEWHMSSDCPIPKNIKDILKKQTWSLHVIKQKNGNITWLENYPLHIL